jgi:hypothetical protein
MIFESGSLSSRLVAVVHGISIASIIAGVTYILIADLFIIPVERTDNFKILIGLFISGLLSN